MIKSFILSVLLLSACNFHEDKKKAQDGEVVDGSSLDFSGITAAVLRPRCFSCHSGASRNGNLSVESYEEVKAKAQKIKALAVTQRSMPPGTGLGNNNAATLAQWIDAGAPNE
jgi:uncharacterized membrane protein